MEQTDSPAKRVVVTGGAGFVGTQLTNSLIEKGYEVHIIDTLVGTLRRDVRPPAVLHTIDIRDKEKLSALFEQLGPIDGIFHAAALPSVPYSLENPLESHDVNVNGTLTVLSVAKKHNVRRVIFSSSCAIYGDTDVIPSDEDTPVMPLSPYALHKRMGEEYCELYSRLYGLPTVALRYYNVYGPGADPYGPYASAIGRFIEMRKQGQTLSITGDGEQTRDMVHVRDIAEANIRALEHPDLGQGEIFNIGTGVQVSINEIARQVGGPTTYVPARKEPRHSCANNQRARQVLGWKPQVSLSEGITELKAEAHLS